MGWDKGRIGQLKNPEKALQIGARYTILLIIGADSARIVIKMAASCFSSQATSWALFSLRIATIIVFNLMLARSLVTTRHGLYYLIDRLYARKPRLLSRRSPPRE